MKKLALVFLLWTGCLLTVMGGNEITGIVISVIDGNTIEIASEGKEIYKIMLAGVDSPELSQAYGEKAKKFLEKLALKKNVTVRFIGKDRWGNQLADVMIDGTLDPRIELLKEGFAWTAERNAVPELEEYRIKAQQKNKGLWKQQDPVPPWTYRRQQTMLQAKSS